MKQPLACLLGGTGFIGHHLAQRLVADGYRCRIPSRRAERHRDLKLFNGIQMWPVVALDAETLARCCDGCDLVVNLIGILSARRPETFERIHVDLVERIVEAMRRAGVPRYLHMSALNADAGHGANLYLRSKGAGEARALAADDCAVTCFRPSAVFGRGDRFFNHFAMWLDIAPGLLPLARARARLAPVWVGDVVAAMARAVPDQRALGRAYDLCGPRAFSLRELVEYSARCRGRRVRILELDERAARLFERLPWQLFGMGHDPLPQADNLCARHDGLLELGIHPTDIEVEVPLYLTP